MKEPDWQRVEEVFAAALACTPADRTAFLETVCGEDVALLKEVNALLQAHAEAQDEGFSLRMDAHPGGQLLNALRSEFIVGQELGRFVVEEYLGEGGMGVVYRARDRENDRPVAIKLLSGSGVSSELRRRLEREAMAMQRLHHPNIVAVEGLYRDHDLDFLVMEYVPGTSLASLLRGSALPLAQSLHIASQCAAALSAAHEAGIVHRDLKPANIMITPEATARLLDFGICSAATKDSARSSSLTAVGTVLGTASYMAPEQAQGDRADCRTDIFALGAVMYEMLSGHRAFDGPNQLATVAQVLRDTPAPLPAAVPAAVERMVTRCLEKDPARRYPTAAALAAELAPLGARASRGNLRGRMPLQTRRMALLSGVAALALATALSITLFRPNGKRDPFTQVTFDTGLTTDPAISRDGRLLAYVSDRSGEGTLDLWAQPLPGGEPFRVAHEQADLHEPAFSPDGSVLAYRSERDGGIYTIPLRGGTAKKIAEGNRPRFSPDGKWIAYWTGFARSSDLFAPGASRIFIIPAEGGAPRAIVPEFAAAAFPVWSPDSLALLFAGQANPLSVTQKYDAWIAPISGGPPVRAGIGNQDLMGWPSEWTLDGRVLSSHVTLEGGPGGLWEIAIRGNRFRGTPRRITSGTAREEKPVASAAGEFALAATVLRNRIIRLALEDGASIPLETISGDHVAARLSSDDNTFLYGTQEGHRASLSTLTIQARDRGERLLIKVPELTWWDIDAAGDQVYYQSGDRILRVPARGGFPVEICSWKEHVWDISGSGRYLMGLSEAQPKRIMLINLDTCGVSELVARPDANLYYAAFSPDENWIVFAAKARPDRMRLYVARRRDYQPIRPEDWVAVSDGSAYDEAPRWSRDGCKIYYCSNRDGYRCVWMQRLDTSNRPVGPVVALKHLHGAIRTRGEFSVSRKSMAVSVEERIGNIWLAAGR